MPSLRQASLFCLSLAVLSQIFLLLLQLESDFPKAASQHGYEAPEPYPDIHGFCSNCNPSIPQSPDPLVSSTWNMANDSKLQIYRVFRPVNYLVSPSDAILGIESFFSNSALTSPLTVSKSCSLRLDWGVERSAWLELTSPDNLLPNNTDFHVHAAISEFNIPYPGKTRPLVRYNHTYRLETNQELYEGVRFTWLFFDLKDNSQAISISNISLVAMIKPTNYTGSFWSSSEELTKAWYMGAYGVRLNMDESYFNSILIERGDREAIQGDGHPTIDAALVAFSPFALIREVLNQSDSANHHVVDQEIMSYPLYWSLSAIDYFMASGDLGTFRLLVPDIVKILDARIQDFLAPDLDIQLLGWDDRLGNGWCFHKKGDRCPREAHLAFAGLVVRVCKDFQHTLLLANMTLKSLKYRHIYEMLGQRYRQVKEWPNGLGVHAAASAINSGISSKNETKYWMTKVLNDPVSICSFSQFNQYWILQALGNANRMEHALASVKLCWAAPMKVGNGCFWEQSMPDWIDFMKDGDVAPTLPSYCHPWSSGVTAWLSHVLGGIKPLLPGYKQVIVSPYVSIRYPSVRSSIATPNGKIQINATLQKHISDVGKTRWIYLASIQSTSSSGYYGIPGRLSMAPSDQGDLAFLTLNGTPVDLLSAEDVKNQMMMMLPNVDDILLFDLSDSFLYVRMEGISNFTIMANYSSTSTVSLGTATSLEYAPFPNPRYPASIAEMDRITKGDGLHTHGSDGYVLLGINENGTDLSKLPTYIANTSVLQHGWPGWFQAKREYMGSSPHNDSYLPTPGKSGRSLGMVGIDDIGGKQPDLNSILVHVEMKTKIPQPVLISLYFVSKKSTDKVAIQVMDMSSLNVVAPTTAISNYQGGVWWTLVYDKSVRLRLMNMQGLHLSAIGFSSLKKWNTPSVAS